MLPMMDTKRSHSYDKIKYIYQRERRAPMAVMTRRKRFWRRLVTNLRGICAVFSPRNLKRSMKSVTKGFREYSCFFIAILVLQTGLVTFSLMTDTNIQYAKTTVTREYDHHLEVVGLDQEQKVNFEYILDLSVAREDPYIQGASYQKEIDDTYTVRITLIDGVNLKDAKAHILGKGFLKNIRATNEDTGTPWVLRVTPLYTLEADYTVTYTLVYMALFALWTGLSVLILFVLYRMRVEHFKFIYGVYMTCGGDFPKLFGAAGGELLSISVLTMLPSILLGTGITALSYVTRGVPLAVSMTTVYGVVIHTLLSVLLAVYVPMRRLSLQPPVKHLLAADHTGMVTSPRRSFRMFGAGYPLKYELFGMWRLRKYYIGLVLSAVFFAAVFVSGLYIADLEKYHNEKDPYEYLVSYVTANVDEAETDEEGNFVSSVVIDAEAAKMIWEDAEIFVEDILKTPGVSYVDWSVTTSGGSLASHLLLTPSQLAGGTDSLVRSRERESQGFKYAMLEYDYTAFDELYIDMLIEKELCTFEGDPYELFEGERRVIITEDSFNQQAYSFSPGDKILVAVFEKANGAIDMVSTPETLLRMQIEKFTFRYVEYTVCAVMREKSSENHITFGVNSDEYESLTGAFPVRDSMKVYMERGSDFDTVKQAENGIRKSLQYCSGWQISPSGNYIQSEINRAKQDRVMIYTLGILLLIISPLIWFFSQIMYYGKRRDEFHILLALGGEEASIAKLHRVAGGVLSCIAFFVTVLLSSGCNAVIHFLLNTLLPKFGLAENVGYVYELSVPALIASALISMVCGFMSCEIPYRLFKRKKKKGIVEVK